MIVNKSKKKSNKKHHDPNPKISSEKRVCWYKKISKLFYYHFLIFKK